MWGSCPGTRVLTLASRHLQEGQALDACVEALVLRSLALDLPEGCPAGPQPASESSAPAVLAHFCSLSC